MDRLRYGLTENQLKEIEHSEILSASSTDRLWWSNPSGRFKNSSEREKAVQEGELVKVEIPNEYFTCPSDIRKDQNLQLLRPAAKELLYQICKDLNGQIGYSKSGIRLAITSLYRSDDLQNEIVNSPEWYRAAVVGTSSHAAGAAFDISLRSHYLVDVNSNQMRPVNNWNDLSALEYQPVVFECLGTILSEYARRGECNLIVENMVEGNEYWPTCFHVCTSPSY